MNSVNVNVPVVNMPQVGNLQSEAQRAPMLHQAQNADMARDRIDLHMRAPNEAEAAEGKIVDPRDRREEKHGSHKREKGEGEDGDEPVDAENDVAVTMLDNGRLIDLEA